MDYDELKSKLENNSQTIRLPDGSTAEIPPYDTRTPLLSSAPWQEFEIKIVYKNGEVQMFGPDNPGLIAKMLDAANVIFSKACRKEKFDLNKFETHFNHEPDRNHKA